MELTRGAPGLLDAILESLSDYAVIVLDHLGVICIWNVGAQRMFQFTEAEMVGKSIDALYTSQDLIVAAPQQERDGAGKAGRILDLQCLRRKDSSTLWTEGTLTPIHGPGGDLLGYLKIIRDATNRKRDRDEMQQLARVDPLTGLSNRIALSERLHQMTEMAARQGKSVVVQMLDLDHYKSINDQLGHAAGDELLQQVARRITAAVREVDLIARVGGDEFVIVLPDVRDPAVGGRVAEQIVASLSEPFLIAGSEVQIGASIGISVYPRDARGPAELLRMADVALYKVKAESRGGYHYFAKQLDDRAHQHGREQRLLRRAVDERAFLLYYQPQVDSTSEQVVAMEALLRCNAPGLAHLSIEEVLSLAVSSGLMREIGAWTVGEACAQTRRWRDMGIHPLRICINMCAAELSDPRIVRHVADALSAARLAPSDFEIEVTERQLLEDSRETGSILDAFRSLGTSIAIDDFGTGYSSLSYLTTLPVDRIKLDRSFVQHIPAVSRGCAIARAIVALAHTLDLEVVAEGVESAEQARFLEESGCEMLQGYHYCRPLSAGAMTQWLERRRSLAPH